MVLFIRFSSLLVLLSLAQVAESQVTIKPYFSSPVRVLEGEPLTLDYSIQGSFFRLEFGVSGAFFHIVEASSDGTTRPFDDRVSMNVTGTNITITYRTVYRNDSNDYTMVAVPSTQGVPPSTSDVEIIVQYPPSLTTRVQDQVVLEGGPPIQLNCTADGEPKPNITWTKITNGSNSNIPFIGETLKLDNNRSNEGRYRCSASNGIGNDVNHTAIVVVNFKPENFMFKVESSNENICKGDTLNITCSAEGKPGVHTYQLFQNNILVHTSNSSELFWSNATTVGGEVMYTCEANNTVSTANTMRTVTVNVPSFIMPISNEVITEGENLNLSCPATGIPPPTVFWIKTSTGERTNGTELFIRNISRSEAGEYRCEAMNPCGNASESATIDVQYPPEGIQLHVSGEEVCNGTTVSFNCSAETANPTELNYQLYENNMMIGVVSSTGVWNKTMTVGGVFVYKCMVNNSVGTAMSSTVSVNVNVPSFITPISNEVITEGGNLNLSCPATGIPPPTVFWVKTSNGERRSGTELVIRNINRSEAGEYRCEAMNPCGNASKSATIDVQYPPEGIQLHVSEEEVCSGTTISFNCSAETANPTELNYQLYENNIVIGVISSTGVWNKTMTVGGVFVYKCMVNNSVGTAMSSNVSVNVNDPSSIRPFTKKERTKGETLTIVCEATGTPPLSVSWVKTSDGVRTNGTELVFTYINRTEAGEYRCEASNLCGNDSESVEIDVFFKPEMVQLFASEETVYYGASITFNCSAYGNPVVLTYQLYENGNMVEQISSTGVWTRTMSTEGEFVFKCMVNNTVGTAMSSNVSVTVNGEKCEPTCTDGKECLAFGTKYFCRCPNGKTGENCQQNDTLVNVVEVGFEFTSEEFKPEYENLEDQITVVLIQKIKQAIRTEMNGTGLLDVIVKKLRSGSVIADVELKFNRSVGEGAIAEVINEALKDNKLGDLDVGQSTIGGFIPGPTEQPIQCSQFFEGPDCKQATGALIALIVVAVVVVVALLIAIVACSLQKKNATGQASVQNGKYSQRQDPEGRHGTVGKEGNAYGGVTSGRNGHGSVNTGFQDETAQAGTPMVTFNSNNAQTPGITLNDSRSQKARPGEGTYADLGDFQQTPSSTTVTTGPLKRGPKYEETPYAEITQFLQGPVEPEKEESPVEVPVNPEGPLEEPEDEVKDDALNNLNDDARDQSNEQTKLYPSLKEVDGGNKTAQFEVSI